MRFIENGPSIPDELLTARDEGRVVFFCGAGVSLARARLPDFAGLAARVLTALEGDVDSDSKRLMRAAADFEKSSGIRGLVPADRIFGYLERDFELVDVQRAVAKALKPARDVDVSAHRILLELSKGPDGRTRLVTTNFELLFEQALPGVKSWLPRELPDPHDPEKFDGVIHLHGKVTRNYEAAENNLFVLSSAEFGRAYISRAWATRFIAAILQRYLVVFVGYSADDPPVQYLLEGLNRDPGSSSGMYAFQAGSHKEAESKWRHKGVTAIAYDDANGHRALWDSLEGWAARAHNVDDWFDGVIEKAASGPESLPSHERGQVKHIVSTRDGARRFSTAKKLPPAEWMLVFDRTARFAAPGRIFDTEEATQIDAFLAYGLDCDEVPAKVHPNNPIPKRDVPKDAWDGLDLTRLDRQGLASSHYPSLAGRAGFSPFLVPRLSYLCDWFSKVCDQPAAVWWAAAKGGLHPGLVFDIKRFLARQTEASTKITRSAWDDLFSAWDSIGDLDRNSEYQLCAIARRDGWTAASVRQYAKLHHPWIKAERPYHGGPKPPAADQCEKKSQLLIRGVEYPRIDGPPELPDDLLKVAIRAWRTVLERAVILEEQTYEYGFNQFKTLAEEAPVEGDPHQDGVIVPLAYFLELFRRLIKLDVAGAKAELSSWWKDDDEIFARLRIWASGERTLLSGHSAGELLCELNDEAFWSHGHQPDLLYVLARRWNELSEASRKMISERTLAGPPVPDEKQETRESRQAFAALQRICWMRSKDCALSFDVDLESRRLRELAPGWKDEYTEGAVESWAPRSGTVTTDLEHSELDAVPTSELLNRAQEIASQREEFSVRKDPLSGLAANKPVRVLTALRLAGKKGDETATAWTTFLHAQAQRHRGQAKPEQKPQSDIRLLGLIALRLSQLPPPKLQEVLRPVADWMLAATASHPTEVQRLDALWTQMFAALQLPQRKRAVPDEGKQPDWASKALNSPPGILAQVLMKDSRKAGDNAEDGFEPGWLKRIEALLSLAGDPRREVLAFLSYNLNWFYFKNPEWTEQNMLRALNDDAEAAALWSGVLWSQKYPSHSLFMRLKPALLDLQRKPWITKHNHIEVVAAFLLNRWLETEEATGKRFITDDEMRTQILFGTDTFRADVLWLLERWSGNAGERWSPQVIRVFLTNAWPRQKVVKTPKVSARLCELAFSSAELLAEIADLASDLITPTEHIHQGLFKLADSPEGLVDKHPDKTLTLLTKVLPEDVRRWPYQIENVLSQIEKAQPALRSDGRLIELLRRWNSR